MSNTKLPKGTILTFTGYADTTDVPLLNIGQQVSVIGYGENGAVQVVAVDDDKVAETLFPDEFEIVDVDTPVVLPLEGVTFDPAATVKDLRAVASDKGTKAVGRTKDDVIASLKEQGAVEQVADEGVRDDADDQVVGGEAEEAPKAKAAPKRVSGQTVGLIKSAIAVPGNTETLPAIIDSARVQELLAAQDALTAAKSLSEQAEEAFFSLGGVLSHVHETEAYKTITDDKGEAKYAGKQGFADYAFNELNVNYRKAMNLIAIYRKFRELDLDETRAIRIGWTKLREMIPVMDEATADDLLDKGDALTRDELVDYIKVSYVSDDEKAATRVKKTRLTFTLFEQNAEVVQNALAAAMDIGAVSTPEQALALICAEWGQLTGNIEVPLAEQIAALEARYDVQIGIREGADRDTAEAELETA